MPDRVSVLFPFHLALIFRRSFADVTQFFQTCMTNRVLYLPDLLSPKQSLLKLLEFCFSAAVAILDLRRSLLVSVEQRVRLPRIFMGRENLEYRAALCAES